jgi:hypothetical protein
VSETSRLLNMAEGRLSHADSHAHDKDQEAAVLRSQVFVHNKLNPNISLNASSNFMCGFFLQLGGAVDNLRGLSSENEALRSDLRAAHEDLEALVQENQAVGKELSAATQQRDMALEDLRRTSSRLGMAEQLVRAKEVEVEDLRRAYEALALEHRRWGG